MNITLHLSPEDQAELDKRAASRGRDVADYIQDVVRQELHAAGNGAIGEPFEEWERRFHEWVASHLSRNPGFDDSRESIYD